MKQAIYEELLHSQGYWCRLPYDVQHLKSHRHLNGGHWDLLLKWRWSLRILHKDDNNDDTQSYVQTRTQDHSHKKANQTLD